MLCNGVFLCEVIVSKHRIKTRQEQRRELDAKMMNTLQLWAHCQNLLREILQQGNILALTEFQQFSQYLPPELRNKIQDQLNKQQCEEST